MKKDEEKIKRAITELLDRAVLEAQEVLLCVFEYDGNSNDRAGDAVRAVMRAVHFATRAQIDMDLASDAEKHLPVADKKLQALIAHAGGIVQRALDQGERISQDFVNVADSADTSCSSENETATNKYATN
jgi:hypothetical protein